MKTQALTITLLAVLVFAGVLMFQTPANGGLTDTNHAQGVKTYEFFDSYSSSTAPYAVGTTTSATSTVASFIHSTNGLFDNGNLNIGGAEKVTLWFGRTSSVGGNAGTSTFRVQVSMDGDNWLDFNKLIDNVTNTNAQMLTRVGSVALLGTSTKAYALDLQHDSFIYLRCIVVEATDGTHRCRATVEY